MRILLCASLMGLIMSAAQEAPLFKPGAPGKPAQRISPADSIAMSQTGYLPADAAFMQDMIIHHGQAVEMNALIADRHQDQRIAKLGTRIATSQTSEIAMMKTWLTERGETIANPDGHLMGGRIAEKLQRQQKMSDAELKDALYNTAPMAGMLSPKQMADLAAAEGKAFDILWLKSMILHHQGAIFMVNTLLKTEGTGEDPALSEFLAAVLSDQAAEISRMTDMLADLSEKQQQTQN